MGDKMIRFYTQFIQFLFPSFEKCHHLKKNTFPKPKWVELVENGSRKIVTHPKNGNAVIFFFLIFLKNRFKKIIMNFSSI